MRTGHTFLVGTLLTLAFLLAAPASAQDAPVAGGREIAPSEGARDAGQADEGSTETVPPLSPTPEAPGGVEALETFSLSDLFESFDFSAPAEPEPTIVSGKSKHSFSNAVWNVLRVAIIAFLLLRAAQWFTRGAARRRAPFAVALHRAWAVIEVTVWGGLAIWAMLQVKEQERATALIVVVVLLCVLIAGAWTFLRDVLAGFVLSFERPFGIGDFVQFEGTAGQVRAFRARTIELLTEEGGRVFVPYRETSGATLVRKGGKRAAFCAELHLGIPKSMDVASAVRLAREVAISAPWAVIGQEPKVSVLHSSESPVLCLEAYAFDREAVLPLRTHVSDVWGELTRPQNGAGE